MAKAFYRNPDCYRTMKTILADAECPRLRSRRCLAGWSDTWHALAIFSFTLISLGALTVARAELSAPDNVIYGSVVLGATQITASSPEFAVEARRPNGLLVARYRMGERPDAGDHYVLAIKVEEMAPLSDAASLLLNEVLTIAVTSNGVEQAQQTFAVTERGQVKHLDFGTLPTNVLSGFEAWALARGLGGSSQNLDADADGVSNLAEYVAGTNPTNNFSKFLLRMARAGAIAQVSFDALQAEGPGYESRIRHYALQRLVNPQAGNWETLSGYSDIIGSNQVVVCEAPISSAPFYFRGVVWLGAGESPPQQELRLLASRNGAQMVISFTALGQDAQSRNRFYTLERTTDLKSDSWIGVPGYSNILGSGQSVICTLPATNPSPTFFRGRVELRRQ